MMVSGLSFIALLIFRTAAITSPAHPLHISVTEIEYNEKNKSFEIMMRIFTDDLEEGVRRQQKDMRLNIMQPPAGKTTDQLIEAYLAAHFRLSVDNKVRKADYLGHELEADAVICYIEVTGIKSWKTIEIKNNILMEVYDDQSNIVNVTVNDKVKSLRLTESEQSGRFTF